jgi:Family of unknown function (DUF5683)
MKYLFIVLLFNCLIVDAQNKKPSTNDSTITINSNNFSKLQLDSAFLKNYKPSIAIKRSAMLPGWGQYTNKKYWKIPFVYAGIGIPAYLFFRNKKQYKEAKAAYINATDGNPLNNNEIGEPYRSVLSQPDIIRNFRNDVRQNVDYSVLFFIIFWGLNVADAAVDANLKTFDVSDDLSLKFKAGYSELANTNGVSFVVSIGKRSPLNSPKKNFKLFLF